MRQLLPLRIIQFNNIARIQILFPTNFFKPHSMNFLLASIGAQELIILLVIPIVSIAIFLAMRALVLWYWKIEKIVDNQQVQIRLLQDLINELNKTTTDR